MPQGITYFPPSSFRFSAGSKNRITTATRPRTAQVIAPGPSLETCCVGGICTTICGCDCTGLAVGTPTDGLLAQSHGSIGRSVELLSNVTAGPGWTTGFFVRYTVFVITLGVGLGKGLWLGVAVTVVFSGVGVTRTVSVTFTVAVAVVVSPGPVTVIVTGGFGGSVFGAVGSTQTHLPICSLEGFGTTPHAEACSFTTRDCVASEHRISDARPLKAVTLTARCLFLSSCPPRQAPGLQAPIAWKPHAPA